MVEYNTINAKLYDSQRNKLKSAVKNEQGTTLRMSSKIFNGNNLPHKLLLRTRQTTKLRNAIENNMATESIGQFSLGPLLKPRLPLLKISHKTVWFVRSHRSKLRN